MIEADRKEDLSHELEDGLYDLVDHTSESSLDDHETANIASDGSPVNRVIVIPGKGQGIIGIS